MHLPYKLITELHEPSGLWTKNKPINISLRITRNHDRKPGRTSQANPIKPSQSPSSQ